MKSELGILNTSDSRRIWEEKHYYVPFIHLSDICNVSIPNCPNEASAVASISVNIKLFNSALTKINARSWSVSIGGVMQRMLINPTRYGLGYTAKVYDGGVLVDIAKYYVDYSNGLVVFNYDAVNPSIRVFYVINTAPPSGGSSSNEVTLPISKLGSGVSVGKAVYFHSCKALGSYEVSDPTQSYGLVSVGSVIEIDSIDITVASNKLVDLVSQINTECASILVSAEVYYDGNYSILIRSQNNSMFIGGASGLIGIHSGVYEGNTYQLADNRFYESSVVCGIVTDITATSFKLAVSGEFTYFGLKEGEYYYLGVDGNVSPVAPWTDVYVKLVFIATSNNTALLSYTDAKRNVASDVKLSGSFNNISANNVEEAITQIDSLLIRRNGVLADYITNDVEEVGTTVYVGKETHDGKWYMRKVIEVGDSVVITHANISNNNSITSYADAWTARLVLTYGKISELTF